MGDTPGILQLTGCAMEGKVTNKKAVVLEHSFRLQKMSALLKQGMVMHRSGFTIVELIVVMAIVAILALLSIPVFNDYVAKTKNKRGIAELRTIDQAIISYILDKNTLPAGLGDVGMGSQQDPWKHLYVYQNLVTTPAGALEYTSLGETNTDYDLSSMGSDGISDTAFAGPGSADDLMRVNNGSYYSKRDDL